MGWGEALGPREAGVDPAEVPRLPLIELARVVDALAQSARPIRGGYATLARAADELRRLATIDADDAAVADYEQRLRDS